MKFHIVLSYCGTHNTQTEYKGPHEFDSVVAEMKSAFYTDLLMNDKSLPTVRSKLDLDGMLDYAIGERMKKLLCNGNIPEVLSVVSIGGKIYESTMSEEFKKAPLPFIEVVRKRM